MAPLFTSPPTCICWSPIGSTFNLSIFAKGNLLLSTSQPSTLGNQRGGVNSYHQQAAGPSVEGPRRGKTGAAKGGRHGEVAALAYDAKASSGGVATGRPQALLGACAGLLLRAWEAKDPLSP